MVAERKQSATSYALRMLCQAHLRRVSFYHILYVMLDTTNNKIQLTKSSSEDEIKRYFNAVLMLSQSDNEFPINLNAVWMLVYGRKQEAVRALTNENSGFIEGVDYQPVRNNAQRSGSGQFIGADYYLSLSCMEYFIARKVRAVFEVYRQVFHKVTKQELQLPNFNNPSEAARAWADQYDANQTLQLENQNLQHENKQLVSENQRNQPKAEFADCIMQSEDCISIGEMANILKQNGLFRKGQNAFFEWLRYNGYLICRGVRYNLPTQKSMNRGLMKIAERPSMFDGGVAINRKAVVTPLGQKFFIDLFKKTPNNVFTPNGLFG